MPVPARLRPLGGWWHALGRLAAGTRAPASEEARRTYLALALDLLARADALHAEWCTELEERRQHEQLANAAAVYHWRLHVLRERLRLAGVPPALQGWHRVLLASLDDACHGLRLISSGYRYYYVRRICQGERLLDEARQQVAAVRDLFAAQA
jgi:hypothetical protein